MLEGRVESSRVILAAVSLGAVCAYFYSFLYTLIEPNHLTVYHLEGRASVYFVPVLVYVMALACLLFALLLATRTRPLLQRFVLACLLGSVPLFIARNLMVSHNKTIGRSGNFLVAGGVMALVLYLGCARSAWAVTQFRRCWTFGRGALAIAGFVGAVTLVQVAWLGWEARHLNDVAPPVQRVSGATAAPRGRVIWIVLDELSYEQVYGRRFPGLELPNFDRLRSEATVFTQVIPAGTQTQTVLPALMTGVPDTGISVSADGRRLRMTTGHGTVLFNPYDTIFSDADRLGYRSGVVGWFNPYCRMLPDVLSSCTWASKFLVDDLFSGTTIRSNLVYPLIHLFRIGRAVLLHRPLHVQDDREEAEMHVEDMLDLDRASDAALGDERLNFLLLHMPIPHPSGIFNRHTGQFSLDGSTSYLDNLVLADMYLGHVRVVLQREHEWDDATIVVMGDHSWRTKTLWVRRAGWTGEDRVASDGGRFDPRPGYVVKLPQQNSAAEIATPFRAVNTRALLQALLAHRIADPAQLQQWVAAAPAR
jgi:hypothetical protein